jgi:UDP-N-acetylglucosamine/UDP-N-acetylgalactosamine diphosphorylase
MTPTLSSIVEQLQQAGQSHLLGFVDQLGESELQSLLQQIAYLDLELVNQLFTNHNDANNPPSLNINTTRSLGIMPPVALRLDEANTPCGVTRRQALTEGERLLRAGKVATLIVAGGQGSRLGFDKPKGMLPIGPISQRTLFEILANKIDALQRDYEATIPLLIMTSPSVHDETISYFEEHDYFGLNDSIEFFCQGILPVVESQSGQILLQSPHTISVSPNGHGGMIEALVANKLLDKYQQAGIEHFFFGQIDNPLSPTCCPELIGFHSLTDSAVTLQAITKQDAQDKTGNIVQMDGRIQMIEYTEMPPQLAKQITPDGQLNFWAANIAVHIFKTSFLKQLAQDPTALPFHTAHKTVAHIDQLGNQIHPTEPNAIKFERFIFDSLSVSPKTTVIEADRNFVFAAVKNHAAASFNTVDTCQQAISALHRNWLIAAGVQVDMDITVEIDPYWARNAQQVGERPDLPQTIKTDIFLTSSRSTAR